MGFELHQSKLRSVSACFPTVLTRPSRRAAVTAGLSGRCYRSRGGVEGGP